MLTRLGRLIKVKNTKAKTFSHENDHYIAVIVKDANGENPKCLLFTESEISRAEHRAYRNPEDIIERNWISKLLD